MTRSNPGRSLAFIALASAVAVVLAAVVMTRFLGEAQPPHSAMRSVFTKPPRLLPRYEQLDAPLMGSGDMAVALCGNPEDQ